MSAQRLPAYAKPLAQARARGMTLRDPSVSVNLSGLRRPNIGYGVACSDGTNPVALDWSWCRRLDVLIFWRSEPEERMRAAVRAIRAARPHRLLVLDCRTPRVINIVRPDREGA